MLQLMLYFVSYLKFPEFQPYYFYTKQRVQPSDMEGSCEYIE